MHTGRFVFSELIAHLDRKSTRLNSSHLVISYAVFCLKKKKRHHTCRNSCQCCISPHRRAGVASSCRRISPTKATCTANCSRPESKFCSSFFFLMIRRPPRSPLFPYPRLFRSGNPTDWPRNAGTSSDWKGGYDATFGAARSEEHTSELQSPCNLVCRLLLEK